MFLCGQHPASGHICIWPYLSLLMVKIRLHFMIYWLQVWLIPIICTCSIKLILFPFPSARFHPFSLIQLKIDRVSLLSSQTIIARATKSSNLLSVYILLLSLSFISSSYGSGPSSSNSSTDAFAAGWADSVWTALTTYSVFSPSSWFFAMTWTWVQLASCLLKNNTPMYPRWNIIWTPLCLLHNWQVYTFPGLRV